MSYTSENLGDGFHEITAEINGEETKFRVCVASEDQLDDVVNFRIGELTVGDESPIVGYAQKRAESYPPVAEQLDYIYHNGIDAWKTDMIDPVKTQFPKE